MALETAVLMIWATISGGGRGDGIVCALDRVGASSAPYAGVPRY
jgi:hypothetical protein